MLRQTLDEPDDESAPRGFHSAAVKSLGMGQECGIRMAFVDANAWKMPSSNTKRLIEYLAKAESCLGPLETSEREALFGTVVFNRLPTRCKVCGVQLI
ncbi:unnamed protein product [Diplocarpon coronariae]